jgi:hypothetical protein
MKKGIMLYNPSCWANHLVVVINKTSESQCNVVVYDGLIYTSDGWIYNNTEISRIYTNIFVEADDHE